MGTLIITENVELYGVILADAGKVIQFPYSGFSEKRKVEWLFYRFTNCRKLRCPFFRSWMHYVFRKWRVTEGDIVLINAITIRSPFWKPDYINELKRKGCKTVLLLLDSIDPSSKDSFYTKMIEAASYSDRVYTFDHNNALQYGWKHTYQYYSKVNKVKAAGGQSDVFCVMWNGGRLRKAVEIYDVLESRGVKCAFFIMGANDEEKKKYGREGIIYNSWLTYEEILGHISQTKVILDIVRGGFSGNTRKRLITHRLDNLLIS